MSPTDSQKVAHPLWPARPREVSGLLPLFTPGRVATLECSFNGQDMFPDSRMVLYSQSG